MPYKKPSNSTDDLPTMIRIDEETLITSENKRDNHSSTMVRDYSISSKDRPTTQTQTSAVEEQQNTATSSWSGTSATTGI